MMNFGDGDAQIVEFSPAFPNHGAFFRRTNQQGAASDGRAVGTELHGALRRPQVERTLANKDEAASYAAYRALSDLMPTESAGILAPLMKQLGYDPNNHSMDIETPAGIGNVACDAVLEFRHHDRSNQLSDLAQGPYTDWSGYTPINRPNNLAKNVSIKPRSSWP